MNDLADCIEELKAENKRLFDAHAVEMVRADKLKGALEFETERANGLAEKVERLRKTISEFLDAISGVPMRAIDCNQEEIDRLQRKLEKEIK